MAKQIKETMGMVIVIAKNRKDLEKYVKHHKKLNISNTRYIDKTNAKRMYGVGSGRVYHVKKKSSYYG